MLKGWVIKRMPLETRNITKKFPGVLAMTKFVLRLKGRNPYLLGENGAGKSTLMNILYGLSTSRGQIF